MTPATEIARRPRNAPSAPAVVNLLAKATLLGLLVFAVLRPDLPQVAGKAMETRLLTFGLSAVLLPAAWRPGLAFVATARIRTRPMP